MVKDLKLGLFSAAISASAGIAATATFGFAAVALFIAVLWRALTEAISETLPDAWHHQYRHALTHARTAGGREQERIRTSPFRFVIIADLSINRDRKLTTLHIRCRTRVLVGGLERPHGHDTISRCYQTREASYGSRFFDAVVRQGR